MKSWVDWVKWVTLASAAAAASVATFNLAIDPYSVFKTAEGMRQGYNPNERYRKIDYLVEHPDKYDSYIIGASTMGLFDPAKAQELHPDGRWYNLSFLAGTPPEAMRSLQLLKRRGQQVKEVVYGIDMFAFRKLEHSRELWRREHPLVTGETWVSWWQRHVFASTLLDGTERLTHNLHEVPRLYFDFDGSGRYYLKRWDKQMAQDPNGFAKEHISDLFPNQGKPITAAGIVLVQERFDELKALKDWMDANGIKSTFWINPLYRRNLDTVDVETLDTFRRKVEDAVGPVADYTKRTDFCDNALLFYDWTHFVPKAGAKILEEVMTNGGDPKFAAHFQQLTRQKKM
jgi:hypothetical protein